MTVYVVLLEDRHADAEIEVFATEARAREAFEAVLRDYPRHASERDQMTPTQVADAGWLAHCELSAEGDQVRLQALVVEE